MNFDESSMPAIQTAERIQRLHHAGSLRPPASDAACETDDGHCAGRECVHAERPVPLGHVATRIQHVARFYIFNCCAERKPVLGEPQSAGTHVLLNGLMLEAIETEI